EPTGLDRLGAFGMPDELTAGKSRNVLYCPSHTRVGGPVWREGWLLDRLREAHEKSGATIFIKPHPFEAAIAPVSRTLAPGLHLIAALDDIYPSLRHFDLLISDYSSLMDDFHLTGRPMLVLQTPQTEKVRQQLLLADLHYRELAPVVTADDLPAAIETALSNTSPQPASGIYTEDHHGSAGRLNRYIAGEVRRGCAVRYRATGLNDRKPDPGENPS
ncbi:MAG: CDP-glycerol glycerophosphotransferase family protein, partial [Rhodospirillales bacterium]